jgi:hypothetical protein
MPRRWPTVKQNLFSIVIPGADLLACLLRHQSPSLMLLESLGLRRDCRSRKRNAGIFQNKQSVEMVKDLAGDLLCARPTKRRLCCEATTRTKEVRKFQNGVNGRKQSLDKK